MLIIQGNVFMIYSQSSAMLEIRIATYLHSGGFFFANWRQWASQILRGIKEEWPSVCSVNRIRLKYDCWKKKLRLRKKRAFACLMNISNTGGVYLSRESYRRRNREVRLRLQVSTSYALLEGKTASRERRVFKACKGVCGGFHSVRVTMACRWFACINWPWRNISA